MMSQLADVNIQSSVGMFAIYRDSRKSRQKMVKNTADFCENRKNHGKNTAKTRHQTTGPKTITQSIKINIWHRRPSLHAEQGFLLQNVVTVEH